MSAGAKLQCFKNFSNQTRNADSYLWELRDQRFCLRCRSLPLFCCMVPKLSGSTNVYAYIIIRNISTQEKMRCEMGNNYYHFFIFWWFKAMKGKLKPRTGNQISTDTESQLAVIANEGSLRLSCVWWLFCRKIGIWERTWNCFLWNC